MSSRMKTATPIAALSDAAQSRRGFLQVGLGFSIALTFATQLSGCAPESAGTAKGMSFLQPGDVSLFRALLPVVASDLAELRPTQREQLIDEVLGHIDGTCAAMALHSRTELRKLLGILSSAPLRWALTGVSSTWGEARAHQVAAFLERWRASRFATLNAGRMVLVKLCCVNYYLMPVTRAASGYPGPRPEIYQAINS
jgi:hypothetical protein